MRQPQDTYFQNREQLLAHEDTIFRSLISHIPDFYPENSTLNIAGAILRATAMEISRIGHLVTVRTGAADPRNLPTMEVMRRFHAPLFLQTAPLINFLDLENKQRILTLLKAYQKGATLEGLEQILGALSGGVVSVVELFKQPGTPSYARNSIQVTVEATDQAVGSLTGELQVALNLAKPAHIGLALNALFIETDKLTNYVKDEIKYVNDEGVEVLLSPSISTQWVEGTPEPEFLHLHKVGGARAQGIPDSRLAPTFVAYTLSPIQLEGLGMQAGGSWTQPLEDGATVKVAGQTTPTENGLYTAKAGTWTRYIPTKSILSPSFQRVWEVKEEGVFILDME